MNKFTVSSFLIGLPRNDGRLGDAALPSASQERPTWYATH